MSGNSLIVTIVQKGWATTVVEAAVKAGAQGSTILNGRGSGIHEKQKLLGIPIEPEKEIVFTVTRSDQSEQILGEIVKSADLDKPGTGMVFVIPVDKVAGIAHLTDNSR